MCTALGPGTQGLKLTTGLFFELFIFWCQIKALKVLLISTEQF